MKVYEGITNPRLAKKRIINWLHLKNSISLAQPNPSLSAPPIDEVSYTTVEHQSNTTVAIQLHNNPILSTRPQPNFPANPVGTQLQSKLSTVVKPLIRNWDEYPIVSNAKATQSTDKARPRGKTCISCRIQRKKELFLLSNMTVLLTSLQCERALPGSWEPRCLCVGQGISPQFCKQWGFKGFRKSWSFIECK